MWTSDFPFAFLTFLRLLALINTSSAIPYLAQKHDSTRETSVMPYNPPSYARYPPSTFANFHTALAVRTQNTTSKGHIEYLDFTFLLPSRAHAALLNKMYSEIYEAVSNTLDSIASFPRIAFTYGLFTLTIYFGRVHVVEALLQLIIDIWKSCRPELYAVAYVSYAVTAYVVLSINDGREARRTRGAQGKRGKGCEVESA